MSDQYHISCLRLLQQPLLLGVLLACTGCGESEDFSQPLQQATQLAQPPAPEVEAVENVSAEESAGASDAAESETEAVAETVPGSEDAPRGSASPTVSNASEAAEAAAAPVADTASVTPPQTSESTATPASPGDKTASGPSSLAARLRQNRSAGNSSRDDDDDDVPNVTVSERRWLTLVDRLRDRFRTSFDIQSKFAVATAGANAVEVVNFESGEQRQLFDELPYTVESLVVLAEPALVLIGTSDGRVVARRYGTAPGRDVYADDLARFLDEHRQSSSVGSGRVVFVRSAGENRIATFTEGDATLRIWNLDDVVHDVVPVDRMTIEGLAGTVPSNPEPLRSIELPGADPIFFNVSIAGQNAALIDSAGLLSVLNLEEAAVTHRITEALLFNQRPSTALFDDGNGILIGTGSGFVLRSELLPTGPGEAQWVVGHRDERNGSPVTVIEPTADTTACLIGRDDGSLTEHNLVAESRKSPVRLHSGPIVEIRISDELGRVTLGSDRVVRLSERPPAPRLARQNASRSLVATTQRRSADRVTLAKDTQRGSLRASDDDDDDTPVRLTNARIEQIAASRSYRPADAAIALLQHQLRTETDPTRRIELQKMIVTRLRSESAAASIGVEPKAGETRDPVLVGEIQTQFEFDARRFREVLVAVSDDAQLVSATLALERGQSRTSVDPLLVWDVATAVELRRWFPTGTVTGLQLSESVHSLIPLPVAARYDLTTGEPDWLLDRDDLFPVSHALTPDRTSVTVGLMTTAGDAVEVLRTMDLASGTVRGGFTAFDAVVPCIAYSPDGGSLFASVRERSRVRTLELHPLTFEVVSVVEEESGYDAWTPIQAQRLDGALGATYLSMSPGGRQLLTLGRYQSGKFRLGVWKRRGNNWPEDAALLSEDSRSFLSQEHPLSAFVANAESEIAIRTTEGVKVFSARTGRGEGELEIPDVGGRAPLTLFSPDGRWMIAGDGSGAVWVRALMNLEREPVSFVAQTSPIVGLALSANGRYLATVGEENQIRVWQVDAWLR